MTLRLLPRSLPGQIALLVAAALFVAQAINFALLVRERQRARFAGATSPAITRLIDASERLNSGRPLASSPSRGRVTVLRMGPMAMPEASTSHPRARVTLVPTNPVDPALPRETAVETAIRDGLSDAGIRVGQVIAAVRPITLDDRRLSRLEPEQARRVRRYGAEMVVAAERPGSGWLTLSVGWPRTERGLIAQLAAQTLILYGIMLLAVLWLGNRIARPLRELARAARAFRPGENAAAVEESGPSDVRAVISAYNSLGQRVTAMLDEKDRMLGAIGHDLRTPLAALRVRIESVEDEQDRQRMAGIIDEMARTLEDILSLARLGRPSEPQVEVDLAALVDAVVDDFRDLGHDIAAEEAARLPMRLRPALMRRAVRNLIENAIKYAGSAEVTVSALPGAARIAVLDRGPGIPPERLASVFDAFVRVETSRNRETGGIGLGLALARAIVEEAGGTITLANREGGGCAAVIELPRR